MVVVDDEIDEVPTQIDVLLQLIEVDDDELEIEFAIDELDVKV